MTFKQIPLLWTFSFAKKKAFLEFSDEDYSEGSLI
jgi:hypothetical protein